MRAPSSASDLSSNNKPGRQSSSRLVWPFSLQSANTIDEFRLSQKDSTEEKGDNTPSTTPSRFAWPLSLSKIQNVDEFRLPAAQRDASTNSLPKPANTRSYELTWPFSMKAFHAIDEFRVPSVDTHNSKSNLQDIKNAVDSVREAILSKLVRSEYDRKDFLPEDSFRVILNRETIQHCLPTASEDLINFIDEKGKRMFATVLSCTDLDSAELVLLLESFRYQQFCDLDFPVARQCPPKCKDQNRAHLHSLTPLKQSIVYHPFWKPHMVRLVYHQQWVFLAPIFSKSVFVYELYDDHILPFTSLSDVGNEGAFSRVHMATMPAEHQDALLNKGGGEVTVAIKELKNVFGDHESESIYDVRSAWQGEVRFLQGLNSFNHENLIYGLASFQRGQRYNLIFPWADGGNLRDFWKRNPNVNMSLSRPMILEYLEQLEGLADALDTMHQSYDPSRPGSRHGDLKPENILVFTNYRWLGTLRIADFGLSKHHRERTELRRGSTETRFGTMLYEPPEVLTRSHMPITRRYDIWSMGCIIFESIIWLLYGLKGLDSFYNMESQNRRIDYKPTTETPYYKITGEGTVELNEELLRWCQEIFPEDPECNTATATALADLLDLVKNRLLVVEYRDHARFSHSSSSLVKQELIMKPQWGPQIVVEQGTQREQVVLEQVVPEQAVPEQAVPVRADAAELRDSIRKIVWRARTDHRYLFSGAERPPLPLHNSRKVSMSGSISPNHQAYNKPISRPHPTHVWHFDEIVQDVMRRQRVRRTLAQRLMESHRSSVEVGGVPNRLPTSSPASSVFPKRGIESSETLSRESSISSKISVSDPVPDQVISSLLGNKSPSEIASMLGNKSPAEIAEMFSNQDPATSESPVTPGEQFTDEKTKTSRRKFNFTFGQQRSGNPSSGKAPSNTSRKRRPLS